MTTTASEQRGNKNTEYNLILNYLTYKLLHLTDWAWILLSWLSSVAFYCVLLSLTTRKDDWLDFLLSSDVSFKSIYSRTLKTSWGLSGSAYCLAPSGWSESRVCMLGRLAVPDSVSNYRHYPFPLSLCEHSALVLRTWIYPGPRLLAGLDQQNAVHL